MERWLEGKRITPPEWTQPEEPIMIAITRAFQTQSRIGWDQLFRGRIATDWHQAIQAYYRERKPGEAFTPDQWMRTTIEEIWIFAMKLWKQRNIDLHGETNEITMERQRKETATKATAVYNATLGKVSQPDSMVLHHERITEILNWTRQHLDAYLATAEVVCAQNVEPG